MVNENITCYVLKNILPLYERNDWAHQWWHIDGVIKRSLKLAKNFDVNLDMVYIVAAFHDIGCYINRDNHEKLSAEILIDDKYLNSYFNEEEMKIMKEAVEDHRGSKEKPPRSIYGKIVSTADRFVTIDGILKSMHLYTLQYQSDFTWERMVDRSFNYLKNKYGPGGYAKVYVDDPDYDNFLNEVEYYLNHKNEFAERLEVIDKQLKKEYIK